jgi:3-dehydroquinate dehydratase-1
MSEQYADCPLVTMAMADIGAISRVTGEVFGSAMTFGQMGNMSAPGQIEASKLSDLLKRLHHTVSIENKL